MVVIAIIGILSSVVLAALNTARGKGADAAIKANLANMRAQAELFYDDTAQSYGSASHALGACAATANTLFANPTITNAITSSGNSSNGTGMPRGTCASTPTAWATSVPLKTVATQSWCVDSTGVSRERLGSITTTNC